MEKQFYIPDIKLVGYGRAQVYQISCLRCSKLFFDDSYKQRYLVNLFCDECRQLEYKKLLSYIKKENTSPVNYVGNVKGWVIKADVSYRRRSRYNYMKVYKRDKYICQYCGYSPYYCEEFKPLHIDHILPWSVRGSNSDKNLVVACAKCNLIAGSKWFNSFEDKKAYILSEIRKRGWKTYFDLKVKFLEQYA
jgi:protein-arginine kinase activator protein McsA